MKWRLIAVLALVLVLVLLAGLAPQLAVAETQSQMRVRVNAELRAPYAYMLEGKDGCNQACINNYLTNGDWMRAGAKFSAPFDWGTATADKQQAWLNDFVLGDIAWSAKKGDEFKALWISSHKREPTKAEWDSFWGNPSNYETRNQAYLDLYNSSPRLDKWINDTGYHRKQEYNHGVE